MTPLEILERLVEIRKNEGYEAFESFCLSLDKGEAERLKDFLDDLSEFCNLTIGSEKR